MKTDSGSLRRLNSWFHPFWKTKYGPERFLLNCCSVYTDWLFVTPWISACQAPLSFTISQSLFKFTSIEAMMSSNHVIPFSSGLQSFPESVLFSESALRIRWPKDWSFSFSNSPSNEYSSWFPLELTGLISLQSKGLSSTTRMESINSSALSPLYEPTLTSIPDPWKNHSLDYMDNQF